MDRARPEPDRRPTGCAASVSVRALGRMVVALVLASGLSACAGPPEALPPCDPAQEEAGLVLCDLRNPEDIALLPGRAWIVVSQMARLDEDPSADPASARPGDLLAIRLADGARRRLFPPNAAEPGPPWPPLPSEERWGDGACPGPPDPARFLPHGIDVGSDRQGRGRLAVVNHGGREAVEIFEIGVRAAPSVEWRGCVPMPEGMMMNDVAWHPAGGFVVTNFSPSLEGRGLATVWTGFEIMTGRETGSVLRWTPEAGLVEIGNSRGSAPNGVAVAPDGSEIFVAEWGAKSVFRLRFDGDGEPLRDAVALEHSPDNLSWTRDGRLLVAGQGGGVLKVLGCNEIEEGACGVDYGVYSIDPVSLEARRLYDGKGAASVALEVEDEVLVGSFVGDRIERRPAPGRSAGSVGSAGPSESNPSETAD